MAREMTTIEGYVYSSNDYRDSDKMVSVFTKEGPISFLARGINKYENKNRGLILPLTYGHFSLEKGKAGGLTLKEGVADSYVDPKGDYLKLAFISYLTELTSKASFFPDNEEVYIYLDAAIKSIDKLPIYTNSILFLSHILSIFGYSPNVDGCLECGKKTDIIGFSFLEGGYFCDEHLISESDRLPSYRLKLIRYLFKSGLKDYDRVSFPDEDAKWALRQLALYAEDIASIHLNSVSLLLK